MPDNKDWSDGKRRGSGDQTSLRWVYQKLKMTGRGKHVGRFSYYHRTLAEGCDGVLSYLEDVVCRMHDAPFEFNVIKLDSHSRVSLLRYEDFATSLFPVLLAALSCDIFRGTARKRIYSTGHNPPILHRKELLLPVDSLLVPEATQLTQELERLGAFADARRIGTRNGWINQLALLGVKLGRGQSTERE